MSNPTETIQPLPSVDELAEQQQTQQVAEQYSEAETTAQQNDVTSATSVSSMEELKSTAPEVHRMMMEGIATNIVNEMKRRQERIKELMREGRRNAGQ